MKDQVRKIKFRERSCIYRIFYQRKLKLVSSGVRKYKGLWIRKRNTTDLGTIQKSWEDLQLPTDHIEVYQVTHSKHGAWVGTAVLLITDTITCVRPFESA